MDEIKAQIQYWIDYKGSGDEYRKSHDLDCILTGGNLYADTLISLWLPLRYVLDFSDTEQWKKYKSCKKNPKNNDEFMSLLKDNLSVFIPNAEIRATLEELFRLGRTRANVIILPYRRWNIVRGRNPYWEYVPHFLYDLLKTEDVDFLETVQRWIEREHLQMFFDGKIEKDSILDLCGLGKPWLHDPKDEKFDVLMLINNYISILEERKKYF